MSGPYPYPWRTHPGWEPGADYYDLPYMRNEIAELGPFDYERLMTPWPRAGLGEAELGIEEGVEEEG